MGPPMGSMPQLGMMGPPMGPMGPPMTMPPQFGPSMGPMGPQMGMFQPALQGPMGQPPADQEGDVAKLMGENPWYGALEDHQQKEAAKAWSMSKKHRRINIVP